MPEKIADNIYLHRLDNGLSVLAESLEHVVSTAMMITLPLGAGRDSELQSGAASVINEWIFRGADGLSSREIASKLDFLGCNRDETVGSETLSLSSSQTDRALYDAMEVYSKLVTKAELDEKHFEPCRQLACQELESLEDQPGRMCALELRKLFYGHPLGLSPYGTADGLAKLTAEQARAHARKYLSPQTATLSVAGKFELGELIDHVEKYFSSWQGPAPRPLTLSENPDKIKYIEKQSSQVQIALACSAPLLGSADYYPCRLAEMVLSGGMSGRLFTEVREKRGLVYSIAAHYRSNTKAGGLFIQAGTAPERAQQTLDVTLEQLKLLADGVSEEELSRAKTQLKAALIMQSERTAARAFSMSNDWHKIQRTRTLEEISTAVDAVSTEKVNDYLAKNPLKDFKAVIIGPGELDCTNII